jgi:hypothetical protein
VELNGKHHILVYADGVNMLGENTNTIKKNTEALFDIRGEVGLEVNTEETKYMDVSCHRNSGQYHSLVTANKSFENAVKFKCLGTRVCINFVQNILSSYRLSKSLRIKV